MTSGAFALGPDEGEQVSYLGGTAVFKIAVELTGGWGVSHETFPAGFASAVHIHRSEDGAFFILAGEMVIECGDQRFRVGQGSFVFMPKDVPHYFRVVSQEPAVWLNI